MSNSAVLETVVIEVRAGKKSGCYDIYIGDNIQSGGYTRVDQAINGAKALALDATTGSLEIGKAADMMAVDISDLSMSPVYEPISHLVYSASRHCVEHVWVNGQQLVKNKQLTTMNEQAIKDKTALWLERINQKN